MKTNKIIVILCLIQIYVSFSCFAQTPVSEKNTNRSIETGKALYHTKNYSAAYLIFENVLQQYLPPSERAVMEYYYASTSLKLFHSDGEKKSILFIETNTENPLAQKLTLDLAHKYYQDQDYSNACKYYQLVNKNLLSPEAAELYSFQYAYSLFYQKEFEKALSLFLSLTTEESEFKIPSLYYSGYIVYHQNKYEQSLSYLQQIDTCEGYKRIVPEMISGILYVQKKYNSCIEYATPFVYEKKESKNPHEISLIVAHAYFDTKDYQNALKYYEIYMKKLDKKPTASLLYRISLSYYYTENYEQAVENFKYVALETDTLAQLSSYYLGELYYKNNNKPFSISAFEKASSYPYNKEIQELAHLKLIQNYIEIGEYTTAIDRLLFFQKSFPASSHLEEINHLLPEVYILVNDYNKAISYFESVSLKTDRIKKAYQKTSFLKGIEEYNNENVENAIQHFKNSLQYPLDSLLVFDSYFWIGESYSVLLDYPLAEQYYRNASTHIQKKTRFLYHFYYGIGYALYNQKKYSEALSFFLSYKNNSQNENTSEVTTRIADCYYTMKEYEKASAFYEKAKKENAKEIDYILFQQGILFVLLDKKEEAEQMLKKLIQEMPESNYVDDASFEIAQMQFESGKYPIAQKLFTDFIDTYSQSSFIPYALIKRATCFSNNLEYEKAGEDYKTILTKYPNHLLSQSALLGLQKIYQTLNKNEELDKAIAIYKTNNATNSTIESVEFERAKNAYFQEKYTDAASLFSIFATTYSNSKYLPEAAYYRAESYFRLHDFENAFKIYTEIETSPNPLFLNRCIPRIAEIELYKKNYLSALIYFKKLISIAQNKKEKFIAREGIMRTYFMLAEYDSTLLYAGAILGDDKITINAHNQAVLYRGKVFFETKNYPAATDEFINLLNEAKDIYAAEAQYYIALIFFHQKKYKSSLDILFDFKKNFSYYEYWLGKSFLLMADNYIEMQELFQAKATLQSIIKKSPLEEIKKQAMDKMILIERKETDTILQKDTVNTHIK